MVTVKNTRKSAMDIAYKCVMARRYLQELYRIAKKGKILMQNKQAQMRENKLSLARLDNTAGKGSRGPNRVNLDVSPQTYAYKTVCTVDTAETRLARKSARALVVLLREKNDRQPSRKFVEGMLRKGYCVPDSRIPHAVRIVYATINKDLEKV